MLPTRRFSTKETDSAKKPEIIEGVNDHPILIERDRKDKKEDAEEGGDSEETTNDSDHDSGTKEVLILKRQALLCHRNLRNKWRLEGQG